MENPKCKNPECTNTVTEKHKRAWMGWKTYCSTKCSNKMKGVNARKTLIENHGDNCYQLINKKVKDTCLKKYGVDNYAKTAECRTKMKSTMKLKYGVEHQMQLTSVKKKIKQTSLERYGTENPSSSVSVKEKRKASVKEKFGVDNVWKSSGIKRKAKQTMLEKYGVEHNSHISIGADTLKKLTDKQWCETFLLTNDLQNFISELKISRPVAIKYLKYHGLINVSKSHFENEMRLFLQTIGITNFVERSRKHIYPLELDFVIDDVAIECNGAYWHSELNSKDKSYHLTKTNKCKEKGIQLIHVWDFEWNEKPDLVKSRLKNKLLKDTQRIPARKTTIVEVTDSRAKEFLIKNHIQQSCPCSVRYGLEYNGELVALMTFSKSRYSKEAEYELLRYCTNQSTVIGGAGKLFSHFVKTINPLSVISYSDKSWNSGKLYSAIGFKHIRTNPPAYRYTKDYVTFENRIDYQKHKLKEKLKIFSPELTEWENMKENGYDRIWDCGTDVFMWRNPNCI